MKNKSEKTVGYAVAICISAVLGIAGYFIFKYVLLGANACKIYPLGTNRHSIIPDFISARANLRFGKPFCHFVTFPLTGEYFFAREAFYL